MKMLATKLAGLVLVETDIRQDARGEFARLYCERELAPAVGGRHVMQANRSLTRTVGAVRGMHYQNPPHAEMKLVRCIRGRVFDVAVDLRAASPTRLQWSGHELSATNGHMLVIPEGFAHGFQALEADSELLYLHTACYEPAAEGGVAPGDPALAIRWPLPIAELSERDRSHPPITAGFGGIAL
jgi:dTDP-4-dehydrorhamnose 3,5-epimerase